MLVPNPNTTPRGDFGPASLLGLVERAQRAHMNCSAGDPTTLDLQHHRAVPGRVVCPAVVCDIPAGNPQGLRVGLASVLRRAMDQAASVRLYRTLVGHTAPQRLLAVQGES